MQIRYSVILGFLGQLTDRFASYHEPRNLEEKLVLAATIEGIKAIEPVYPFDFPDIGFDEYRRLLQEAGLSVSSINVNVKAESKFHLGAFTARDPGVRREAVQYLRVGMDWAAELGCNLVTVCPLSDGHDYPFEINYRDAYCWLLDCVAEAAEYRPQVRLSLEYKQSEPRGRVILPNAGVTLHLCDQIGLPNVGVTVDIGHALYAGETPAQSISLASQAEKLFLVHINDNYRNWDWDMLPGTVNYWDWLETLFVMEEVGYEGWLVSDIFPSRIDPVTSLSACYRNILYGERILNKMGRQRLRDCVSGSDIVETFDFLQKVLVGEN